LLGIFLISLIVAQPAIAKKHEIAKEDVRGIVVTSVDVANSKIVLTIEHNKQEITYAVPLGTAITINGEPASLDKIRAGMYVVSYTDADAGTLSQLDVTTNPDK